MSPLIAGGLSNFVGRLLHDGKGVDFINLGIGPLRTGILNVAHRRISAGLITLLFGARRHPTS